MSEYTYTDRDNDTIRVEDTSDGVAYIFSPGGTILDREAAVGVIEALTNAVEAADTREAEAARKLKRGDEVAFVGYDGRYRYTVISDEENGRVDVVSHTDRRIYERTSVIDYERIPTA
ncbi:hypothetical protein [Streptomyces sp. NPDC003952]